MQSIESYDYILKTIKDRRELILVTLIAAKGSIPSYTGSKMICSFSGEILKGTIGGGKVEAEVLRTCRNVQEWQEQNCLVKTWNLRRDIGMTCGGEVSFLFEIIRQVPKFRIVIFGAGHVSQALTRLLLNLDISLKVIDGRKEWLDKLPDSAKLEKIHESDGKNLVKEIEPDSFLCLMTMGHSTDLPILNEALKYDFPYIGVIGSESKKQTLLKSLDHDLNQVEKFSCPMGLPFGGNAPYEIAFSMIAELLSKRDTYFKGQF